VGDEIVSGPNIVNQVARALKEFSGEDVTATQVYNHLRKWRQRWGKVFKLKDLSGALWDEDTCFIVLDHKHYLGHIKVIELCCYLFE
jgi:methionine salvage enolase-phosphatase E1